MVDEPLVEKLWKQQSVWSQTADRMKSAVERTRAAGLALTILGALLGTLAGAVSSSAPTAGAGLAVAAAIGVGLLPLVRPHYTGKALRDWTRARSVSEALKSHAYLYLARAGAYRNNDRDERLAKATSRIRDMAKDMLPHQNGIAPESRPLPDVHDHRSYLAVRVTSQIDDYYYENAKRLQKRLKEFRVVQLGFSIVAVVLGALASRYNSWGLGPWIAVVTTITAAMSAHIAAGRYEYQLTEYLQTADELTRLKGEGLSSTSAEELNRIVTRCERVISSQNRGWMAKLSSAPGKQ